MGAASLLAVADLAGVRAADQALTSASVAAIDLEMTGLDPLHDRICEIGVVSTSPDGSLRRWSTLVRPGVRMSAEALAVHGISEEAVAEAPTFTQISEQLIAELAGKVVVGHGLEVDRQFLAAAWARLGVAFDASDWFDTLLLARRLLALPRHRLMDLTAALGVAQAQQHRALADAEAALGVWQALVGLLEPDAGYTVADLRAQIAALARRTPLRSEQKLMLRRAFQARNVVRVAYIGVDAGGQLRRTEREIEIWKIAFPRVQGWCRLRGEERVFRLDRMLRVEVGIEPYTIPSFASRI